jgi:hypothetical protein
MECYDKVPEAIMFGALARNIQLKILVSEDAISRRVNALELIDLSKGPLDFRLQAICHI